MRILQICNKIPYPPKDGGSIAILNLATAMANSGHDVSVLAMNTVKHYFRPELIPGEVRSKIVFDYVDVDTEIKPLHLVANLLLSDLPYNARRFLSHNFSKALIASLNKTTYDVIQLEGLYLCPYIPLLKRHSNALIAYRAHNVESEIWKRITNSVSNPLKKLYLAILTRRLRKLEQKMLNTYDVLIPISERDNMTFREWGNRKPVHISPTGIPASHFKSQHPAGVIRRLFFIGALDWIPNQEGLCWLLDKVWTEISRKIPGSELHIAGRNAPGWLIEKIRRSTARFHGEVDDALRFFDANDIMLVPLFAGSGMRIKIIEAMARSKVVIATPVGAEGLGLGNGKQICIAESPEDFISAIEKVTADNRFFSVMAKSAFEYTKANFGNEEIINRLVDFYKEYLR
jgi:glycosyltransferase involved in cell wall biosynthesis